MNFRFALRALTVCGILIGSTPLFAQVQYGPLTPGEKRMYHACLYAHFIDNYCRFHAWGYFPQAFRDCVIANNGCGCAIADGPYWEPDIDDACRVVRIHR
jgi:hypothetical protein